MPVKVYSRKTCAPCHALKNYLKLQNVQFEELDVEDPKNLEEMLKISGLTMVPTTVIGDQVVPGLNFSLISKLLML